MTENFVEWLVSLTEVYPPFLVAFIMLMTMVIESIVPMLPLALFIAISKIIFGDLIGFLIGWIGTIIGCTVSFYIFRNIKRTKIGMKVRNYKKVNRLLNGLENIKFRNYVLITAIPFTPAFSINIASGLSNVSFKKFLIMIIISKVSIVYFWGFIGKTFIESITDFSVMLQVSIILVIVYIVSHLVQKHFKII